MHFSVIIPTHNRCVLVSRAIDSVLRQTYRDFELIVIDDGSDDETVAYIRTQYPDVRLIALQSNYGAATARNVGIKMTMGHLVAFLDSDDAWRPEYLERQAKSLASSHALFSYAHYTEEPQGIERRISPSRGDLIVSLLLNNFMHSLSQVVIRRETIEQVGGFDIRLLVCHDRELYLRLLQYARSQTEIGQSPLAIVDECLVQKFWSQDSLVLQNNSETWRRDGQAMLDIFYSNPVNQGYLHLRSMAEKLFNARVNSVVKSQKSMQL